MRKNKNYSNEYKFKVALEMIKGDMTIAEIISKYQVPRSVLHKWKSKLISSGPELFNSKNNKSINNSEINQLHTIIGRLKVENDFLQEVSARLKM